MFPVTMSLTVYGVRWKLRLVKLWLRQRVALSPLTERP